MSVFATISHTDCTFTGANDGTITFYNPTGGTGTYEYSINGGSTWEAPNAPFNSRIYSNLIPQIYDCRIRDAAIIIDQAIINPALEIKEIIITILNDHSICYNTQPSLLYLEVENAELPYQKYEWKIVDQYAVAFTGITVSTGNTYQPSILTGTTYYRVMIIDNLSHTGLSTITPIVVYPQILFNTTILNDTITITPLSGLAPYLFSIDGGNTFISSAFPYTFTNLVNNLYNCIVIDAHGCTSTVKQVAVNAFKVLYKNNGSLLTLNNKIIN